MYLVIIDPIPETFRHFEEARSRYETLVVTRDVTASLDDESAHRRQAGKPEGTEIDRIVECDTGDAAVVLGAIEHFRGEIAGVMAGDERSVRVASAVGQRLGLARGSPAVLGLQPGGPT